MARSASTVLVVGLSVLVLVSGAPGCRRADEDAPPVAVPSFSANRTRVPLGSPVEIQYRLQVTPEAPPISENLRVMVHFLDSDEELLWTDDHEPPVPTSRWKPGQTMEYARTVFIPIFPYVGPVGVHMGLYSPASGRRFPLKGETTGQRSYRVGELELVPRPEDAFIIYKDGWHNAEVAQENAAIEWQWTKREATLSFRNPRRDAIFYLHVDGRPDLLGEAVVVELRIADAVIDRFTLDTVDEVIRKVPVSAAQFGTTESVDLRIVVDRTFVPSLVPAAKSNDARELGVRVFHAYIEPK
jgi:hypothetical protein